MNDIYKVIHSNYEKLSEAEQEVIDFILKFENIETLKLKDIKDELYVSNATVIRACKKLNYATFNELKNAFTLSRKEKQSGHSAEVDFFQIVKGIKKDLLTTLKLVDEENIEQICDCLIQARRIFCVGTGSSSQVAAEFNHNLNVLDLWTSDCSDAFSIERIPNISTEQDVVIVFSLSGEVESVNEILVKVKSRGTIIIAVTNMSSNELKSISNHSLLMYSSPRDRAKLRSGLMLHVMGALIYEKLMMKMSTLV